MFAKTIRRGMSDKLQNIHTYLPAVAVVILNWNGRHFLEKFLPSVLASSYQNIRIIVADNASSDDSVSFLRQVFPEVEIIINPANEGFAKGYNTALQQVNAAYFVLLNSDVEVTKNWIEPVIGLMESDPRIGACQPKLLDEKNRNYFEYAGASGGWIDKFGYPFTRGRVLETIEKDNGRYDDAVPCFWASGACLFVRAPIYKEMRGLDEYFFAHQEEIDLCWRMQRSGYKIFIQPASVVYHVGGGTLPKGNSKKTYLNFRNNLIMLYKNMPAVELIWKLPVRLSLDAIAAWRGFFKGDFGYFLTIVRAHLHFIRWILLYQKRSVFSAGKNRNIAGRYGGSILWDWYVKNKKTFSEIMKLK